MNTIVALRYAVFAFFILLNALVGSLSAWNLGLAVVVNAQRPVQAVEIFLIVLGVFGVIFSFAILGIELIKREALSSRVVFELIWVAIFGSAHLAGAITVSVSKNLCTDEVKKDACNNIGILTAVTGLAAAVYFVYLAALLTFSVVRSHRNLNIWSASVRDFAWFPSSNASGTSINNIVSTLPTLNRSNTYDSEATITEKEKGDLEAYSIVPKGYGYHHPNAQLGVDAINKAPVYAPGTDSTYADHRQPSAEPYHTPGYLSYQLPNPPQPVALRHPYAEIGEKTDASYSGIISSYHTNGYPSSDRSPSPAVIQKASRVPQVSTRPRGGSVPMLYGNEVDQKHSPDHRPLQTEQVNASVYSHQTRGHSQSFGGDPTFSSRRPNKHRPPPLNLSALSNIANAGKR